MAIITGLLVFNLNRTGVIDPTIDAGIGNIPIVLQSTDSTLRTLATYTDDSGEYKFENVPLGDYRVVIVNTYDGLIIASPADFNANATQASEVQTAILPDYTVIDPNIVADGMNALSAVSPTTVNLSITENRVNIADFFLGPAEYSPLQIDSSIVISPDNLITVADNGIFGSLPQGSNANSGPATNPYASQNLTNDFTFVQEANKIPKGYFTIGNTFSPVIQDYNWWNLSDYTTSIEIGMMQIIHGEGLNKPFFTTTVNNLEKNTFYLLSAWISNIDKTPGVPNSQIGISINGLNNFNILYNNNSQDIVASSDFPIWQQIGIIFNTDENTSILLNLLDKDGMAYAIDEIKLNKVTLPTFAVQKSVSPTFANVGEIVTYTFKLTNNSNTNLSNINFIDRLTNGIEFVQRSVKINQVANPTLNPTVGFTIASVAANSTLSIVFDVIVTSLEPNPYIYNLAKVEFEYTPIIGVNSISSPQEIAISPLYVGKAIINNDSFKKESTYKNATILQEIPYTITINNTGNVNATNLILTDLLPPNSSYISNSLSVKLKNTGENVAYSGSIEDKITIDLVKPNNENQIIVEYKLYTTQVPDNNPLVNNANITYNYTQNPSFPEKATESTSDFAEVNIYKYSLQVHESAKPVVLLSVGDTVTYTLTIKNSNPSLNPSNVIATDIIVTDPLSPHLKFVDGSTTIDGIASDDDITKGVYVNKDLNINDSVTITFKATIISNPPSNIIQTVSNIKYNLKNQYESVDNLNLNSNKIFLVVGRLNQIVSIIHTDNLISVDNYTDRYITYVGDIINFTIIVTNLGNYNIGTISHPVTLYNSLSESVSIIPNTLIINNIPIYYSNLYEINLGILTPGETKIVSFSAIVNYNYPNPIYSQAKVFYGYDPMFLASSTYSYSSNILTINIY